MGVNKSKEKKVQRLEKEIKKHASNPKTVANLKGKINGLGEKKKK